MLLKNPRLTAKKGIAYPMIRFPYNMGHLIGKTTVIHQIYGTRFLVEINGGIKPTESLKTKPRIQTTKGKERTKNHAVPRAGIEPATFRSSV